MVQAMHCAPGVHRGEWSAMRDIARRLWRLEEALCELDCTCATAGREIAIVVADRDWTKEQSRRADEEKAYACPVHGRRLPPVILHISPTDARL